MNELEFRAWDTDTQQFINCDEHTLLQVKNNYAGLGNRYIYNLFTGLTDKNGVKIFERDLLECTDGINTWITHVQFDEENGMWHRFQDYSIGLRIGTIYENPELLEAK